MNNEQWWLCERCQSHYQGESKCPCCGEKTGVKTNVNGDISTVIYCFNLDCPAKILGKINRFVKSLKILEILSPSIKTEALKVCPSFTIFALWIKILPIFL